MNRFPYSGILKKLHVFFPVPLFLFSEKKIPLLRFIHTVLCFLLRKQLTNPSEPKAENNLEDYPCLQTQID